MKGVVLSMIKIFICPKCYNFRMVSRKPSAECYHCDAHLVKTELEYTTYMDMSEGERNNFKENFKNRMLSYNDKLRDLFAVEKQEKPVR